MMENTGTTVHNIKVEKYDVYIGRPTIFGNPFQIGIDGNRKEVLQLYQRYFDDKIKNPQFKKQIESLKGKRLGCYCKPLNCHGDIIAHWLNDSH